MEGYIPMRVRDEVREIFVSTLNLEQRRNSLHSNTILLGNIPEFDSMAVINLITALEEYFGIMFVDDEINAETFQTLGSLSAFVERKLR